MARGKLIKQRYYIAVSMNTVFKLEPVHPESKKSQKIKDHFKLANTPKVLRNEILAIGLGYNGYSW